MLTSLTPFVTSIETYEAGPFLGHLYTDTDVQWRGSNVKKKNKQCKQDFQGYIIVLSEGQ